MAEKLIGANKRRRTQKNNLSPLDPTSLDQHTFPLMLAASFNIQNPHARSFIIKPFLLSLIQAPSLLPQSFLSLLPLLLNHKYPFVASLSLELIGAVSLCSFESNARIASDEMAVKGLVWGLGSKSRRLAKAACNAMMDLATSPFGCERLRQSSAVEKLL